MKFNLEIPYEAKEATSYFQRLQSKRNIIELKKVSPHRTGNQNRYLHLIIGAFGNHFGYDLEEAKIIYKEISASIYSYKKKGRTFWRSSADLTKDEMALTIDNFMKVSAEHGYPLPLATDLGWLREIENEIERSKYN